MGCSVSGKITFVEHRYHVIFLLLFTCAKIPCFKYAVYVYTALKVVI